MDIITVFVKHPQPGTVKTRLTPFLSPSAAAALYRAFIRDTLIKVTGMPRIGIHVAYTPPGAGAAVRSLCDAPGVDWFPQSGKDLGARMWHAFQRAFRQGAQRVLTIGSDSPTLPPDILNQAFEALSRTDATLGPAKDGGYYLIGLTNRDSLMESYASLFEGVAWSTETVYSQTLERIRTFGIRYAELPVWADVDRPEDLPVLAEYIRQRRAIGDRKTAVHTERMLRALRDKVETVKEPFSSSGRKWRTLG